MFAALFAITLSWPTILILLALVGFLWFAVRAIRDFIEWFKDEILDDYRNRDQKKQKQKTSS